MPERTLEQKIDRIVALAELANDHKLFVSYQRVVNDGEVVVGSTRYVSVDVALQSLESEVHARIDQFHAGAAYNTAAASNLVARLSELP